MSTVQQLYELQEIDLERDKRRSRLKGILDQLAEPAELRATHAKLNDLETELKLLRVSRQDLDMQTKSLEAKIASVEEQLYGGLVKNPKELSDLQKDSAALQKQRGALDEKSLQAIMAVEEKETAQAQAQAALSALQAAWATLQQSLTQEQAELTTQLAELDRARAEHAGGIPAADLAQYELLRKRKNGRAVAVIEENSCSVCGVELSEHNLTLIILDQVLVFCGNCERILVE